MGTDAFQEVDVLGLSLAVTKHSFMVTDVTELEHTLNEAFELAMSGRGARFWWIFLKTFNWLKCSLNRV